MTVTVRNLAVEIDGAGPGVLMIHGLGGTSNIYQVQAEALAEEYAVIRVDLAGAGRSPVSDNITIDSHADDLAAIIRATDHDTVAVVGHSMGTLVARSLAARYPRLVNRLVLLGAVAQPSDAARSAQQERASTVRNGGTAAIAPGIIAMGLSAETRRSRPEIAAFVRELVMRQDAEGYARNCEAFANSGEPYPISSSTPLLLITGNEDKVGPPQVSQDLAAVHPSAKVKIVSDIGHWTALEAASLVTSELRTFLRQ
ncbi:MULTISPECIES: alpha/beta fold hydrolase [unclassified Mycolicibacterium]|uniref:alpha/beta fold hydrolase n=1 Tax=unclassified Mycolicibacterium TaxID=2636767 RepID=UPI002EDA4291